MKAEFKKMSLYVGTYKKYNEGSLFGEWVKLSDFTSKDEFLQHCAELHKDEIDPEFMFQDCEYFPSSWYWESGVDDELWDLLAMDEHEQFMVLLYQEATGYNLEDCLSSYEDVFYFHESEAWDTMTELYPQIDEIQKMGLDFVNISEERFCDMFTEVNIGGERYYVDLG